MLDLELFTTKLDTPLLKALQKIEDNTYGVIFICEKKKVIGIATDGDIRRELLKNKRIHTTIETCMNSNFIWAEDKTSRENILKLLDHKTSVIPILNKDKYLIDIVSRNEFPLKKQDKVVIRSKSPVRISFSGGGTDLTHFFVDNENGAVLNSTLQIYSHCSLSRKESGIIINSRDLEKRVELNSIDELSEHVEFILIQSLLNLINPDFGFELIIYSDFPVGSGLGGSSVVLSSIIGCFNELREDRWDRHEIAELAFQAERLVSNINGGWQDQYATVFGGFNFMEFKESENIIHPLKINRETLLELEGNLLLCNTNIFHSSDKIHIDQKKTYNSCPKVQEHVKLSKILTYKMRSLLLRGNLMEFGKSLSKAWSLKQQFSSKISNPSLDEIYNMAIFNGAVGGKLLGAGGGGFFLFYVPPEVRFSVINSLEKMNLKTRQVRFDKHGLQTWKVRKED